MAVEYWFDSKVYFDNKLASLKGYNDLSLIAAFKAAGYDDTPEGLYQHFLDYGNAEGISPNSWFNSQEYLYNKAVSYFHRTNVTTDQIKSMQLAMADGGMSPWDHFNKYWAEYFGDADPTTSDFLNPSASFDVAAYMQAKLKTMPAGYTMEQLVKDFKDCDLDPIEHYLLYGKGENLVPVPVDGAMPGNAIMLAPGAESLYGTTGADYFYAKLGTLDDNDYIDGRGGDDTLYANIEAGKAISPEITNVETILFRVQQNAFGGGDNLTNGNIDAEFISLDKGQKLVLGSDNSRANLIIEDIRHLSTDTAIRFSNTDPGVSFKAYFHDQWLANDTTTTTGTLNIQLMDVKNGQLNNKPLYDNVFDQFIFQYTDNAGNTQMVTLELGLVSKEAGYPELLKAFQDALVAAGMDGKVTAKLNGTFDASSTVNGITYSHTGDLIVLESANGSVAVVDDKGEPIGDAGWKSSIGKVPPAGRLVWDASNVSDTSCPLLTTMIELDNVGHLRWDDNNTECLPDNSMYGSQAGDMVVGIMGGRGGLERFNVTVDKSSWLSTLSSTNNTLRMVKVVNGAINEGNDGGHLFIGRSIDAIARGEFVDDGNHTDLGLYHWMDAPRLLTTNGLTDVKFFDSKGMGGNVNIGAQLTADCYDKYLKDVDGILDINGQYAPNGAFQYLFGVGNDTLNMEVNMGIAADRDFKLDINMGDGNDLVNFTFTNPTSPRMLDQIALKNVNIDLGAGHDTAWFWGNGAVNVLDGAGNDKLYLGQNANDQNAVFVLGNTGLPGQAFIYAGPDGAQPLQNEVTSTNAKGISFDNKVAADDVLFMTITFAGIKKVVKIDLDAKQTGIDADTLNKAIIDAINNDAKLGALLVAKDGMGYSLLVESLIDGTYLANDAAGFSLAFALWKDDGKTAAGGTITTDGIYTGTATDNVDQAVYGVKFVASHLSIIMEGNTAGNVQEQQVLTVAKDFFTTGAATDMVTLVVNGKAYSAVRGADAAAFDVAMTAVLGDATTGVGAGTTVKSTLNADGTWDILLTGPTAGTNLSNDTVIGFGEPDNATGTDIGTISHNTVTMGAGDDVIALNVHSSANAFDTLVFTGAFGNDTVVGFNTGIDKINLVALSAGKDANTTATGGGLGANATVTYTGELKIADALGSINGAGTWQGNDKGVVFVQNGDSGVYTVFQVVNDGTGQVVATEVTILGTFTGEGDLFAAGDFKIA